MVNRSVSTEPAVSSNELEFSFQELFELDADPLANDTEDDPDIEHLPDIGRITSGLIKDVCAELGSKLDKWKVPSTISNKFVTQQKKNERQWHYHEKQKNQRKAKQMEGLEPQPCKNSSDDKDDMPSVRPRAKKARMSQKIAADKENDDEYELTAYIVVQNKDVAAGSSRRKKAVVENSSTTSGPISILSSHTYNNFLCAIGTCVKRPVHHLILRSMSYCPQTPKTSVPLPVGTKDAFQAMQSFFRSRSHSSVSGALNVFITMEKPIKPLDETTDWEMDEKAFNSDDAFTSTSVTAQKLSFDDANKPAKDLLLSTYQIGNNKDYPDLHVFTNSDGSWELNDTCLSVWASHITHRTEGVDKDHPPVSQWFDFKHVIKPVKTNTINPVTNLFERIDGTFMLQQMGPLPPYFFLPHFYPNAPPSQSFYTHGPAPHGYYTHGAPPMFASSYQPALSTPTSPSNSPNVTLSSFCQFYHISDVDRQRLEMLKYRPGNRAIESLEKEEWSGAGFKPLSWSNIVTIHQKFLKDVKAGVWDHCKD